MRPLDQSDIFQIEITQRCFLKCGNCTHGVAAFEHPIEMPLETFERAVDSMEGYPGLIGLIGGEPTTHSQFDEICRIFRKKWGEKTPRHGRKPIKDFNGYVTERLFDRTSRRGLWTSLGAGFYRHYEEITDTFGHLCVNDHRNPGLHQALYVTRKEMGVGDAEWEVLRDKCWVANTWSGSITVHGVGYFCEVSGMIDSLYNGGANGWKLEKGWWKRQPKDYGKQLDLCESCGLALPGPALEGRKDKTILTPLSLAKLQQVNAPLVRRGDYVLYDPAKPEESQAAVDAENRAVVTKDSYMPCSDMRVAADNDSIRPKHVSCVVVCVGRAHHLAMTLPRNVQQVDDIVVVTATWDVDTQEVARSVAGVRIVVSDRCYDDDSAFNKGAMINDGLAMLGPKADWVVLTDADVFLNDGLREYTKTHALNPGVLYGSLRKESPTDNPSGLNAEPNGFFALFNRRASAIAAKWPAVMSENFCSAGGIDSWFMQQFPADKRFVVPELAVKHIPHGDKLGAGWNGAETERPHWRQMGMMTARGLIVTEAPPVGPLKLKFTDTLRGETWSGELPDRRVPGDVLHGDGKGGLVFLGSSIGGHHVHVAWWCDKLAVTRSSRSASNPLQEERQ